LAIGCPVVAESGIALKARGSAGEGEGRGTDGRRAGDGRFVVDGYGHHDGGVVDMNNWCLARHHPRLAPVGHCEGAHHIDPITDA
jgi:hypothetical protein